MLLINRSTSTLYNNPHFTYSQQHALKVKGNVVLCLARRESTSAAAATTASTGLVTVTAVAAAAIVFWCGVAETNAIEVRSPQEQEETLANIPQTLSSECSPAEKDCKKRTRIQRPKSRKAESCTINCVTTCVRGGGGSPGEGPFNVRRPIVVFKQGFRSRHYCLVECSDICNLIGDGDDGP